MQFLNDYFICYRGKKLFKPTWLYVENHLLPKPIKWSLQQELQSSVSDSCQ